MVAGGHVKSNNMKKDTRYYRRPGLGDEWDSGTGEGSRIFLADCDESGFLREIYYVVINNKTETCLENTIWSG